MKAEHQVQQCTQLMMVLIAIGLYCWALDSSVSLASKLD